VEKLNAPIIFFAYSRHQSVKRALESLKQNELSGESDLYIYADGPKANADQSTREAIIKTREVIRSDRWCKNVFIEEAEVNKGLAKSVINGVTKIVNKYGKAIIVEDDALLSPYFLRYMNDALNMYEHDQQVFGIGGWTYFEGRGKIKKPFFLRFPDSLTWGIYRRSWQLFIHDAAIAKKQLEESGLMEKFNPFRKLHFFDSMLDNQIQGKIDSWAIRWTATTVLHKGLILYPACSMARNMGNTDGTHEQGFDYNADLPIADNPAFIQKQEIIESNKGLEAWKKFARIHFLNDSLSARAKSTVNKILPLSVKRILRLLLKTVRS
jgi:hypothetical protein